MYEGYLSDISGIKVGHFQDDEAKTGVTVVLPPEGNTCAVDVRGGAPGTRETDLLKPENSVSEVHALLLSGGSAYGLAASIGVMEALEKDGKGFDVGVGKVPIVPQAVLFDLAYGSANVRPDAEMGKKAYENAKIGSQSQGCVGAGCGATVGKALGMEYVTKSGLGSATVTLGDLKVSALVAVNAFGEIYDAETGKQIAGVQKEGKFLRIMDLLGTMKGGFADIEGQNTTIGIVATNATFNKTQLSKLASITHNGYARSIFPVHTLLDGDTIFALATNEVEADLNVVGAMATKAMSMAIANSIYSVHGESK
ncbi:P1 family peptidase [Peptoniphilus sp. KCTC 25270]|uniref:P1 family peptidase n=1 Tax=Peptoniphilus sp. KCTC 25270 TaxID=2897414 RepID=UPI001E46B993|nr:P1 family peptidase [Peptoniphilus sp. KCTC 25270]MCD1147277.1 P1 family peptidase [Peptoniphilus sp. KCTC 25270]